MSVPRHWRLWLLVLLAAGLMIWRLQPDVVDVETVAVAAGPLRETVDEDGETRVHDRYTVAVPIAGRLTRVRLRAGDSVSRGDLVAWIEPAPLDVRLRRQAAAQVEAAEDARHAADAAVLAAEAALDQAVRVRVRAESLTVQGHLSPAAREDAQLAEDIHRREAQATRARAEAAAHEVERARAALLAASETGSSRKERTPIHAPVGGRVLRILEENERVVAAGTPLMELGDPGRLEVVADLLSSDAVKVRPGDTVLVEQWGGGDTLRARVRMVEPSGFTKVSALGVEEQRVNVVADLVDAPGTLGDRYRVEVRVVLWGAPDALKVPLSALVRDGEIWKVFVVSGGRARSRPITPGHRGAFEVEVVSGLEPGEEIIRYPSELIREGLRVRVVGAGAAR
jgi:HlyD family secretion protein